MDKSTRNTLIAVGSILLVCGCVTAVIFATGLWAFGSFVNWAEQSVSESPEVAVRVGSEIADYELPNGFGSPYSVHFGDVTMVGYQSENGKSHILLAQFPEGTSINVDEMLKEISEYSDEPNSIWYNTETTLIEQKTVTICGQETTLNISEGKSSDGTIYRSATATFQGRSGPALVLVAAPIDEWDIEMVDTFIESIQSDTGRHDPLEQAQTALVTGSF
ncbi:MAG TPA: hypothetical protein VFR47_21270 [Anaerolineales bacterium]|nr:hypothetical protein [Anaerolineales bacterium]